MKKSFIKEKLYGLGVLFAQSVFLAGVTIFTVFSVGCSMDVKKTDKVEGDHSAPVIEDVKVVDENTLEIDFSEGVTVETGSVTEVGKDENEEGDVAAGETENSVKPEVSYEDDNTKVIITLPEETEPGNDYIISGTVEDERGNTLTFSIPFVGYNGNLPKVVMTEIQTESVTQSSSEKKDGIYRNEFVEFLALTDGNLAGFELVSVYDGEERSYVFPKIDVKAGEIFVVHLRNRGEGCISEVNEDLSVAFGGYSKDGIRDLWSESDSTALGNDTDIIYLKNSADGSIWDAIMFRSDKVTEWASKYVPTAEMLVERGFYESVDISAATVTEGLTASKTLNRKNGYVLYEQALSGEGKDMNYPIPVTAGDWEVNSASCGELLK